jgi:hypothetical protein
MMIMPIILASHDLRHFTFLPDLLSKLRVQDHYGYAFNVDFPDGSRLDKDNVLILPDGCRLTAIEAYDAAARGLDGLTLVTGSPSDEEAVAMKWGEWPKEC